MEGQARRFGPSRVLVSTRGVALLQEAASTGVRWEGVDPGRTNGITIIPPRFSEKNCSFYMVQSNTFNSKWGSASHIFSAFVLFGSYPVHEGL